MVQLDGINLKRARVRGRKRRRKGWKAAMGNKKKMLSLPALRSIGCKRRQPSLERAEETESFEDSQIQVNTGGGKVSHKPLKLL